jgi:hypothetical protein
MSDLASTGVIVKTHVESAAGAALRVEKVTLTTFAKGLLQADSVGIQQTPSGVAARPEPATGPAVGTDRE